MKIGVKLSATSSHVIRTTEVATALLTAIALLLGCVLVSQCIAVTIVNILVGVCQRPMGNFRTDLLISN